MTKRRLPLIWISRIVNSNFPYYIPNIFLASILKLSFFPNIWFLYFFLARLAYINLDFLLIYICALAWLNLGPYLIWYYDEKLSNEFFKNISSIYLSKKKLNQFFFEHKKIFAQKYWIVILPWIIFLSYIYSNSMQILTNGGGIFNNHDVFYWIGLLGIIWLGILTGIGFWGVITTILTIKKIVKQDFIVDPFHPDGSGGLASVGNFTIGTTILFASGSLILPAATKLTAFHSPIKNFVYIGVSLYSFFILLSFLYPNIIIHQKAKLLKQKSLKDINKKYYEIIDKLQKKIKPTTKNIYYLELNRLRYYYLDFKNAKFYCFDVDVMTKLITSALLPFIFLLIQLAWS